jgi:hypothetical protein
MGTPPAGASIDPCHYLIWVQEKRSFICGRVGDGFDDVNLNQGVSSSCYINHAPKYGIIQHEPVAPHECLSLHDILKMAR